MNIWYYGAGAERANLFESLFDYPIGTKVEKFEAGFAYASLTGALSLRNAINGSAALRGANKSIYLGIHHGITEPKAIKLLKEIDRTEVFVMSPTGRMDAAALRSTPIYHPKYCALFCKNGEDRWLVGSANLTGAGIGGSGNFEVGTINSFHGAGKNRFRRDFKNWLGTQNALSLSTTNARIAQYEALRLNFLRDHPIILDQAESPDDLSAAKSLFLDVGAANGMDRHQVEFTRKLASFFGPISTSRRDLRLRRGNMTWDSRPLTPKKTGYNVEIYRLGMPTIRSDGVPIADRAIKFTRSFESDKFDFEVEDLGGPAYDSWVRECNSQGQLGSTSGGRSFGYVF